MKSSHYESTQMTDHAVKFHENRCDESRLILDLVKNVIWMIRAAVVVVDKIQTLPFLNAFG